MKLSFFKQFVVCSLVAGAVLASCEKAKEVDDIGNDGHTIVKVVGGGTEADPGFVAKAIDFVPTPSIIVGADIRRDIPNNTDLNKTMIVTVKDDLAAIDAANAADPDLHLVHLNPSWYTVGASTPKTGGPGGTYTVTLAPGEFAKNIDITIPDATVLDPSTQYGLAFTIKTADADGQIAAEGRTVIVTIGAKNKYDGKYMLKGVHNRVPNNFPFEEPMDMVTTGASAVRFYFTAAGNFGHPIGVATGTSWYGATMSPVVEFNPTTNLGVNVYNAIPGTQIFMYNSTTSVTRFEPSTKTMYVYWYYITGAGQDFSNRGWSDTLTYVGSR